MPFKDHLHIRGEHIEAYSLDSLKLGSPPHTWRTRNSKEEWGYGTGITSTYVENTLCRSIVSQFFMDHLHIRGEHGRSTPSVNKLTGSPPHTWRTLIVRDSSTAKHGITSTYVENTIVLKLCTVLK